MAQGTKIICVCVCVCVYLCAYIFIYVFFYTLEFLEICKSGGARSPEYILTNVNHCHIRMVAPNLDPCKTKCIKLQH